MSDSPTYPQSLHIVNYPDPVLRRKAEPVTVFDQALAQFCQAMFARMEASHGVGLAAPQVGVSKRIFVTNHTGAGEDAASDQRVWINPELTLSGPGVSHEEGCLSLPGLYGPVERPSAVHVRWQDELGTTHELELNSANGDFLAIVLQHEFDHLNGILFLDHLEPAALAAG